MTTVFPSHLLAGWLCRIFLAALLGLPSGMTAAQAAQTNASGATSAGTTSAAAASAGAVSAGATSAGAASAGTTTAGATAAGATAAGATAAGATTAGKRSLTPGATPPVKLKAELPSAVERARTPSAAPAITPGAAVAPADKNKTQTQCHGRRDQIFVAHEDDDLLFMNPDIHDTIRAGGCVQVVYLTAGERGEGVGYMSQRENGVRAAYALMAGAVNTWVPSALLVNKVQIAQYALWKNPRVSLVFMRIRDPWLDKGWGDLTPLSRLDFQPDQMAQSLGDYFETYSRDSLVKTLSALILRFEPGKIRLMDDSVETPYSKLCWRCVGHDHPDHIASARLVRDAMAITSGNYEAVSYVNYPNQERPLTLTLHQLSEKSRVFNLYAQYDYRYCSVPLNCKEPLGPAALWAERMYYADQSDAPVVPLYTEASGLNLFARGEYSDAVVYWSDSRQRWTVLGGLVFSSVKPFTDPSGRLAVFARDGQGQLYFRRAMSPVPNSPASWTPWYRLPVLLTTQPQVQSGKRQIEAMALSADGYYYHLRSSDMLTWHKTRLPLLKTASQTFAYLADGPQQFVLAQTLKGEFELTARDEKGGWSPWTPVSGPDGQGGLTAVIMDHNRLLAYYRNRPDGHLYLATGTLGGTNRKPFLNWISIEDKGPEFQGAPAVLKTAAGQLVVATMSRTGKSVWTQIDGVTQRIKGPFASVPSLIGNGDAVMLYVRKAGDNRWIQQYAALRLSGSQWQDASTIIAPPFYGGHSFDGSTDIPEQEQAQQQLQQRASDNSLQGKGTAAPALPVQSGSPLERLLQ